MIGVSGKRQRKRSVLRLGFRTRLLPLFLLLCHIPANAQLPPSDPGENRANLVSDTAEIAERLGVITSIGVPQPFAIGLDWTRPQDPDLSFVAEAGWFAFGFGNNRKLSAWSVQGGVRYRPWSDWFFTGIHFGFRRVGLTADISSFEMDGEPLASSASMGLNTLYFGLLVGGQWHLSPKVAMAVDLGVQVSPFAWGAVDIAADPSVNDGTDLSVDASGPMRRIAMLPLPQIALLRFIWYL